MSKLMRALNEAFDGADAAASALSGLEEDMPRSRHREKFSTLAGKASSLLQSIRELSQEVAYEEAAEEIRGRAKGVPTDDPQRPTDA